MLSFHGDSSIKKKYLKRVRAHQKADNLVRGIGWQNGKGCAVGCTLENYDHKGYETELGIPEWLARVEDTLFEGMNQKKSKTWPANFLKAISVGIDLEPVKGKFCAYTLRKTITYIDCGEFDYVAKVLEEVAKLHEDGGTKEQFSAAWSAAWSAASAAESPAWSAASAASVARSAAWSAAGAAENAAESAAWSAAYDDYADNLLELLRDFK